MTTKQTPTPKKRWWIKKRCNPQLPAYYAPYGRMSDAAAKRCEKSLYGGNVMLPFETEADYIAAIERLKQSGELIQDPTC